MLNIKIYYLKIYCCVENCDEKFLQTPLINSNIENTAIELSKGGFFLRTFFGSTFIDKEKLEEAGVNYPIKLEYYKQINEDDVNSDNKAKYGISIVKTEYTPNNLKVETKDIKYVTNDEIEENKILNIFKENQVTLINSEEVISDLFRKRFY